jgi:hypothetical protein
MKWKLKNKTLDGNVFTISVDHESMNKVGRLKSELKAKNEAEILSLALTALEEKIHRIKKRQMKRKIVKLTTKDFSKHGISG